MSTFLDVHSRWDAAWGAAVVDGSIDGRDFIAVGSLRLTDGGATSQSRMLKKIFTKVRYACLLAILVITT